MAKSSQPAVLDVAQARPEPIDLTEAFGAPDETPEAYDTATEPVAQQPSKQAVSVAQPAVTPPAKKASVIGALAQRLSCEPTKLIPLLKKTAFSTCRTDEEFMAMCMVANTYNLNPILKEIYAFPSKGGAVVPMVGVDGWIKIINSHPQFDGVQFEEGFDENGGDYCTAIVYRKDRAHATSVTEWLRECAGTSIPWQKFPRRMLRHKALVQCARLAFGFAGIFDEDEAERISTCEALRHQPTSQDGSSLRDVVLG